MAITGELLRCKPGLPAGKRKQGEPAPLPYKAYRHGESGMDQIDPKTVKHYGGTIVTYIDDIAHTYDVLCLHR